MATRFPTNQSSFMAFKSSASDLFASGATILNQPQNVTWNWIFESFSIVRHRRFRRLIDHPRRGAMMETRGLIFRGVNELNRREPIVYCRTRGLDSCGVSHVAKLFEKANQIGGGWPIEIDRHRHWTFPASPLTRVSRSAIHFEIELKRSGGGVHYESSHTWNVHSFNQPPAAPSTAPLLFRSELHASFLKQFYQYDFKPSFLSFHFARSPSSVGKTLPVAATDRSDVTHNQIYWLKHHSTLDLIQRSHTPASLPRYPI